MDHYATLDDDGLDPLRDPAPRRPSRRVQRSTRRRPRGDRNQQQTQQERPVSSTGTPPRQPTVRRHSHASSAQQSHARETPHRSSPPRDHHTVVTSASQQMQSVSHSRAPLILQQQQQQVIDDPFVTSSGTNPNAAVSIQAQIEQLKRKGFSSGLARELAANTPAFAYRIWIVDNSQSMEIMDGHKILQKDDSKKISQFRVSRWQELEETVMYHAEMAAILEAPTVFRLLNDPGPAVGPQEHHVRPATATEDIRKLGLAMYKTKPLGVTPLTNHIMDIASFLEQMAPQLRREGKRVAVILATDGLPTDEEGYGGEDVTREFVQALQSMEGLPIWLVIRLCTDEEKVTDFYNNLDGRFDLSLEVLDDFLGEAAEVYQHNKWLNYCLPIHRCRELGYHDRLFDLIDERALTKGELRDFCALLFGMDTQRIPDPNVDWKEFSRFVQESLVAEPNQYDPIKKKVLPLLHVRTLNRTYGKGGGKCSIM